MAKRTIRSRRTSNASPTSSRAVSPGESLARVLELPHLARVVPHLAPETLHQLIQHGGLTACSELVAAATPAQLTSIFDLDLWRLSNAGQDAGFDAERFVEWLEMLAETDATMAARALAAMDTKLVAVGLSQFVRVFDPGTTMPTAQSDDEPLVTDMSGGKTPEYEIGGYLLRPGRNDFWDAISTVLSALDAEDEDHFHAVMRACRRLSNSAPEVDGLDDLLSVPAQATYDVAGDRDARRSSQGYSTAADARAFLRLARVGWASDDRKDVPLNPIAAAHFRGDDTEPDDVAEGRTGEEPPGEEPLREAAEPPPGELEGVVLLLAEAGLVPQQPRALLESAAPPDDRLTHIRTLMAYVRAHDEVAYLARGRELAFLANTLVAGCSLQSRAFTPLEASDAAVGVCNLGLEHWPARWPGTLEEKGQAATHGAAPVSPGFLVEHDLVTAFEVGWATLHAEVSLFAAAQLSAALAHLRTGDAEVQRGLRVLRAELRKHHDAGEPWLARDALDTIATLDPLAWVSLLGLLGECPIIPTAIIAVLEGRTGGISATSFDFISTTSQIQSIRAFMTRVPDLLRS